ncbi:poly [ADP-ribose] polymerase 1 [Carica papaya]|uniref:poly [ADP-ribose] polymerase 1 n=1 Tax=Carica papaya TaxID=3649 RepID=UPI000B8C8C4D|nr:poly [ADP-ribose] polymerase 1 [Carica papaya]
MAMANPPKPWKAEYAKSARSSCRTCKSPINKEGFRLGKMVQSTQFDGFMPMWHHANCILKKAKQIKSIDDVEGLESLRWEDQQKIRKYVEGGGTTNNDNAVTKMEFSIEVSQTSRATCRRCNQKITKGEVRISSKPDGQGAKGLAWHHANCFMEASPSVQVEKLSGWESLPVSDQALVLGLVKKVCPTAKSGTETEIEGGKELDQLTSKAGTKRRRDNNGDQKSKILKAEHGVSTSRAGSKGIVSSAEEQPKVSDLESKLEFQAKELWALKDLLKEHVTTAELREMLEINGQDSTGSELDLRDRCADGMIFGPLASCPVCSGPLRYSGGVFRCHGHLSEWSKCSYSTCEPERIKRKWKIPEGKDNQFLTKWFKSQKGKKPVRIVPPASGKTSASGAANGMSQSSQNENLGDLSVSISGVAKESIEEWKRKIEEAGGQFHSKIKKGVNCLVVSGLLDIQDAEMRKARRMKISIVREDYLVDCFKRQKKLPFDLYKVEATGEASSMVTVKVKGRSAVHEASGLQDSGHILEDGKSIYNTTLSLSDLSTGVNRCVVLNTVKMLEALQDIEIASRLVGFDVDNDDSLDEKYRKLQCNITPLPHDSEDYRLIEKYLKTTHAPTHTDWTLELEEVFLLEREGELDKFAPHREKLGNRMLLWHGSRLTNFVGILSQGLRIAPPEAPVTGYMFGKGVYFADLVSKSAQYCYTDKKNPVGLMLLSEVALGEIYELKKAKYMDKPPKGKHSTKGLGKKVPQESEFVKWRDDVIIPCGKPVTSSVKASELMYNEYIVYDTAQVKMQFLLKVRFHHKR